MERDETFRPDNTERFWDGQEDQRDQNHRGMLLPDRGIRATQRWRRAAPTPPSRQSLAFLKPLCVFLDYYFFFPQVNPSATLMWFVMRPQISYQASCLGRGLSTATRSSKGWWKETTSPSGWRDQPPCWYNSSAAILITPVHLNQMERFLNSLDWSPVSIFF